MSRLTSAMRIARTPIASQHKLARRIDVLTRRNSIDSSEVALITVACSPQRDKQHDLWLVSSWWIIPPIPRRRWRERRRSALAKAGVAHRPWQALLLTHAAPGIHHHSASKPPTLNAAAGCFSGLSLWLTSTVSVNSCYCEIFEHSRTISQPFWTIITHQLNIVHY